MESITCVNLNIQVKNSIKIEKSNGEIIYRTKPPTVISLQKERITMTNKLIKNIENVKEKLLTNEFKNNYI